MKLRTLTILVLAAALTVLTCPAWGQDVCQTVAGNEIVNCGFEFGGNAFTGWTWTGNTGFTAVTTYPPYVYSGNYAALMGPVGSDGYFTQNPGGNAFTFAFRQDPSYWLLDSIEAVDLGSLGGGLNLWYVQFSLANLGGPTNDFTVYWNGVDVGPSLVDVDAFPYEVFSGYLVGSSVPEPGSLILMGSGLLGLAGVIRRKLGA
ncbi:MAG TPA: PEP-CTERM sorting domain-containing protein [Candidatus Eisenbacteria bacterium]|nr:PEP-CTERM sorting domain-containing protein [Candidatus Eisenbacteria bacterium]